MCFGNRAWLRHGLMSSKLSYLQSGTQKQGGHVAMSSIHSISGTPHLGRDGKCRSDLNLDEAILIQRRGRAERRNGTRCASDSRPTANIV